MTGEESSAQAEENTDFIFKVTYAQDILMYLLCTGEAECINKYWKDDDCHFLEVNK